MPEVAVLLPGYSRWTRDGRQCAGGTVTLVTGGPNVVVDTGSPEQRQQLLDALAARGLTPADIEYVVLTHGHLDHIGNNNLFPHATFLLATDVGRHGEYSVHDFDRAPFLIDARGGGPPIRVIATPGHTDHDVSVVVETANGTVVITGDLFGHDGDGIDNVWQEYTQDRDLQERNRARILELADWIVPGHGAMFAVHRRTASGD